MEELLDGFKLWGPFAVFFVATLVFGWRILNRREDKLEARHKELLSQVREDSQRRDDKLETLIKDSINQLREDSQRRDDKLETLIKDSIDQLREDIRQTNTRLDASTQALGAEISKLAEKIEANSHDLRMEIARLNQNHVNHLEHHEEFRQRSEQE